MLEFLSVLCHRLSSLSQLEEFLLRGIPDVVWEIFRGEFPPECLLSHRLVSLLHDGFGADPLMFGFSGEHIYCKCQPVIYWTHLRVEDSLHVLLPLVYGVRTRLAPKLHRVMLQEVFQAPLPDGRSWLGTKNRCGCPVLLQLAEGLHMLFVSILSSHPRSLHLLHYQLLLLK